MGCGDDEKGQVAARCGVSLSVRRRGASATAKRSGLGCGFFLQRLLFLLEAPNPVELGGSCAAHKEVDSKQVPVLRDYDQGISGPDQACRCQHCGLGGTEFICWSCHIS